MPHDQTIQITVSDNGLSMSNRFTYDLLDGDNGQEAIFSAIKIMRKELEISKCNSEELNLDFSTNIIVV